MNDYVEFNTQTSQYRLDVILPRKGDQESVFMLTKLQIKEGEHSAVLPKQNFFARKSDIGLVYGCLFVGDMHTSHVSDPKGITDLLERY